MPVARSRRPGCPLRGRRVSPLVPRHPLVGVPSRDETRLDFDDHNAFWNVCPPPRSARGKTSGESFLSLNSILISPDLASLDVCCLSIEHSAHPAATYELVRAFARRFLSRLSVALLSPNLVPTSFRLKSTSSWCLRSLAAFLLFLCGGCRRFWPMSWNLQDRVDLGPLLAAFSVAFLAAFFSVVKDADDFGLMSWNLQNRVVSKTLLSFFLSWRHVPCVTERKSARSDFSDCSPGEISRLPETYSFLTSLSFASQRNLSPETSSWILRKRLLGLKPCSWAQCRISLGFLDLRFYMSRLRSLVTRLPYKKNKRDANTISGYNITIDSFLFLSFLFFLVWFPFCNRENFHTRYTT